MDAPINAEAIATLNGALAQAQATIEAGRMQADASRFSGFAALVAGGLALVGGYIASGPHRREVSARVDGVRYTLLVILDRYDTALFNEEFSAAMMEEGERLKPSCPLLPQELSLEFKAEHALLGARFVSAMVALHQAYEENRRWCDFHRKIGTISTQEIDDYRGPALEPTAEYGRGLAHKVYERRMEDLGVIVRRAKHAALPWRERLVDTLKRNWRRWRARGQTSIIAGS